jgi:transcription initiation factor TFIIIB Brf1 subunit/transcription initiation factor TFIIB
MEGDRMKCENCKVDDSSIDDNLGETVCNACGYVMVSSVLEDTVPISVLENNVWMSSGMENQQFLSRTGDRGILGSNISQYGVRGGQHNQFNSSLMKRLMRTQKMFKGSQDQSIQKGLLEINMVLSPYLPNNNLKDRAHHYYRKMFFDRVMTGYTIDVRACALSLIVLRENGVPITIAELSQINGVQPSRVSKCAKKIARELGKPYILHSMPISSWANRVTYDLITTKFGDTTLKQSFRRDAINVIEYIHNHVTSRDVTFTKSYIASSLWITVCLRAFGNNPEFTQHEIGAVCNCTPVSLRSRNKELFKAFNIKKEDLVKLTVKQFLTGVRYE